MKTEIVFYVVTESGGIHKVSLTETSASVKKVFTFDPKKSKAEVGYELGSQLPFVGITKHWGLWKFSSDNGKKPDYFSGGQWEGYHIHTSLIAGLFFEESFAIDFCKENYGKYNTREWYLKEDFNKVISELKSHPLVLIEE